MPSFFTTSTPKRPTPVFAGLDDPFNFPASKMKYSSRSRPRTSSPDSATDSGYGSVDSSDNERPLSPGTSLPAEHKRRLQKDAKGHWRMQSYEYQSEDNDARAERQPILTHPQTQPQPQPQPQRQRPQGPRFPDNEHAWKPNLKHTFTLIVNEDAATKPTKREKWFTKRVYGRALKQKERSEGLTQLQRDMAPVLRRASPSRADTSLLTSNNKNTSSSSSSSNGSAKVLRPSPGARKHSTLLHPSPPPAPQDTIRLVTASSDEVCETRGRARKASTLLHPSAPPPPSSSSSSSSSSTNKALPSTPSTPPTTSPSSSSSDSGVLRSPRHRSPTPLAIPTHSDGQPAPTPLRVRFPADARTRRGSVLHSCFSDGEDGEAQDEEGSGDEEDGDAAAAATAHGDHHLTKVNSTPSCSSSSSNDGEEDDEEDDEEDATSDTEDADAPFPLCPSLLCSPQPADTASFTPHNNGIILARTAYVARAQRVRVVGLHTVQHTTVKGNGSGSGGRRGSGSGSGSKERVRRKRCSDLIPRCPEPVPR